MKSLMSYKAHSQIFAEGTVQGTYTLADYVTAMVSDGQENTALDNLLVALYNFTVEAKEYKAYADTNGLN